MTALARRASESPPIILTPLPFFWDSPVSVSPSPFWSYLCRLSAEPMSLGGHPASRTVLPFTQTANSTAEVLPLHDGGREQWLHGELIGWRILPLRQHKLPPFPLRPPDCQHWCLSAGGQTSEQTLPIREVTPLVWQTRAHCAWEHSREPYGLHKKRFARGETRGAPEGNLCQMGGPFWCSTQVKLEDGLPFDVDIIQAIVAPLPITLSFRGCLQRIHLGCLKPLLFFCSSLFPQVSYGFAPLCGENRAGKYQ